MSDLYDIPTRNAPLVRMDLRKKTCFICKCPLGNGVCLFDCDDDATGYHERCFQDYWDEEDLKLATFVSVASSSRSRFAVVAPDTIKVLYVPLLRKLRLAKCELSVMPSCGLSAKKPRRDVFESYRLVLDSRADPHLLRFSSSLVDGVDVGEFSVPGTGISTQTLPLVQQWCTALLVVTVVVPAANAEETRFAFKAVAANDADTKTMQDCRVFAFVAPDRVPPREHEKVEISLVALITGPPSLRDLDAIALDFLLDPSLSFDYLACVSGETTASLLNNRTTSVAQQQVLQETLARSFKPVDANIVTTAMLLRNNLQAALSKVGVTESLHMNLEHLVEGTIEHNSLVVTANARRASDASLFYFAECVLDDNGIIASCNLLRGLAVYGTALSKPCMPIIVPADTSFQAFLARTYSLKVERCV